MERKRIWKRVLSFMLALAMVVSGFAISPREAKAAIEGASYKELWFGNWNQNLGAEPIFGSTVYALPEGTITSLDGVAISGNVKFETTARLHIGATDALKHGGFWLWKDDYGLHLSPQGIGGDGGDNYAIHGDTWAAVKDKKFLLRLTFDNNGTGWDVGIYVNDTYVQTLTYHGATVALEPGLYIGIEDGVTVDMTIPSDSTDSDYKELLFGNWSVDLGNDPIFNSPLYALPEGTITSLDGVAVSGNIKFGSTNKLRIGGTEALPHAGFWFWKDDNGVRLSPQGIGGDGGDHYAIYGDAWNGVKDKTFLLRLTFDDIGTGWNVGIYVNNTYFQTLTYPGEINALEPGLLLGVDEGITIDMSLPEDPDESGFNEMIFGDWGVSEGNHYGTDVYSPTDASLTSLNGVAISGKIRFDEEWKFLKIGGTESVPHGGFFIWDDGGQMTISPQEIGLADNNVAIAGDAWAALKGKEFLLRLTFEELETAWVVGVYANGVHYQDLSFAKDGSEKAPGIYIGIDAGITIDMSNPDDEKPETQVILPTAGTVTVSDPMLNGVTDEGITYAGNGGQISYETLTAPGAFIMLFESYSDINASMFVQTAGNNKAFVLNFAEPIKVSDYNTMEINMFMCGCTSTEEVKTSIYASGAKSLATDKAKDVFTTQGNYNIEQIWTLDLTKYAEPDGYVRNLTFLYNADAVSYYSFGAFRLSKDKDKYITLTFSDWGLKDGTYSTAARNFALKEEKITSLNGYAVEGYVNFHETGSYLRIAGATSNPHYALQVHAIGSNQIGLINFLNLDNGQPTFSPVGYSAAKEAKIRLTFDETARNTWSVGFWVNDAYMGSMKLTNTALGTSLLYAGDAITFKSVAGAFEYDNQVNYDEYLTPIWEGNTVYDEAVMPLTNKDGSLSPIALLYDIDEIISVKSADLQTTYTAGKDYKVENGKLVIPTGSKIPVTDYAEYYLESPSANAFAGTNGGYLYFSEDGWFHNRQVVVTYTHSDEWTGSVPEKQGEKLTNIKDKLTNKEPVTVAFYGDSITEGANASAFIKKAPRLETYAELVVEAMRRTYGYDDIHYVNTALGGQTTSWGAENVQTRVVMHEPDLLFIAFGMNDALIPTADYKANIESIINSVRATNPDCDIVLVGTMLPNEEISGVYGNQIKFVDELNAIAEEYSNVIVADVTNVHKSLLETKLYRDMTGNNVNHPNDFLGRIYAQVIMQSMYFRIVGVNYTEMDFTDWNQFVEYNSISKGNVYSLANDKITSLDGVAISGDVKFGLQGAKLCIGSTEELKHGGFWMWADDNGLHLSPQGIGTATTNGDVYVVSDDDWNAIKDTYFNLRVTFDEGEEGWKVRVYVNDKFAKSVNIKGDLQPGLYMSIGSGVYINMTNENYEELTFADWNMYDGIVPYPSENKDYLHALNYANITSLEGYALTGEISFNGGYLRIGTHSDFAYHGLELAVNGSTLQLQNWLDATAPIVGLYTFAEDEKLATKVPVRIEFENISKTKMRVHVYVNNSHKRTLDLNIDALVDGKDVQAGTNILTSNKNGNTKVYSNKKTYKEVTFANFQQQSGAGNRVGFLWEDGKLAVGESVFGHKYSWGDTLEGYALTGRIVFGNGAFRFAGTNTSGSHGVELSVVGNELRIINHKNTADTDGLPALYVGDDVATREFLIRIEFEKLASTMLKFTLYVDGITKQSFVFSNATSYAYGAALWFNKPDQTMSATSVENAAMVFADGIYVKDLTKKFEFAKDAVLVNGHIRTEYAAGSKVTLKRGIYQMFYKEQMNFDTCNIYAYVQGDLDVDEVGVCNLSDLMRAKKVLKEQAELSDLGLVSGDFNRNGTLDDNDFEILQAILISVDEQMILQRPAANSKVDLLGADLNEAVENYTMENYGTIDNLNPNKEDVHETNEVTLEWFAKAGATYKVYVSTQKDMSDAVVYNTDISMLTIYNLVPDTTYYWKVKAILADDTKVVSDIKSFTTQDNKIRTIVVDGLPNVRDIGGLTSTDGTKRIKYGMIYRGGSTNYVTELGKSQAAMLGVKTELDLRAPGGEAVDTKPFGEDVNYVNISGVHYAIQAQENYTTLVEELRVFADATAYPVYFHCSLGRDRTGTLAFLLEALAGVSEADLLLDYELSRLSFIGSATSANADLLQNVMNMYNVINTNYDGETFQDKTWNYLQHIGLTEAEITAIYDNIVVEVLDEEEMAKCLTFSDWGIDMGACNGNKTYTLTEDSRIESLDGVTISGKVNFNGSLKYMNIGGTPELRHAGFWLLDTTAGLRMSPQGIGGPGADIVIVGAEEWETLSKQEITLKLSFEQKNNGWVVGVSVNGKLRNKTLYEGVEPGLYIGISPEITVDKKTVLPEEQNVKYFIDHVDNIKWNGRTSIQAAGIAADATATGFEAVIKAKGSVVLDAVVTKKTWFTVYVDGVRQEDAITLEPTKRKAQIASFSDGKEHHIRVVKQNEASFSLCTMISLTFDGIFGKKPAEKEKYIEIIGDSITAGLGMLETPENQNTIEVDHDGTYAFPFMTAEMLDADVSVVSCSGIGASAHPNTHWFIEHDFYQRTSLFRDENVFYEFERKADMVVINLGTNDVMAYQVDKATFVKEAKRLVELIREKNGEGVPIIWTDNMMGYSVKEWVSEVFEEFGGEDAGLYLYEFEPNNDGGGSHPTKEAHATSATALVDYIKKSIWSEP